MHLAVARRRSEPGSLCFGPDPPLPFWPVLTSTEHAAPQQGTQTDVPSAEISPAGLGSQDNRSVCCSTACSEMVPGFPGESLAPGNAELSWQRYQGGRVPHRKPRGRSTHMLVYIRWPFCWFCRRVFARSMGNTQVTPISPAIPPLISLAGKLRGDRTQKQLSQRWVWRLRAAARDLAVGSSQTRAGAGEVLPAGAKQELGAAGNSFLLPGSHSSFLLPGSPAAGAAGGRGAKDGQQPRLSPQPGARQC